VVLVKEGTPLDFAPRKADDNDSARTPRVSATHRVTPRDSVLTAVEAVALQHYSGTPAFRVRSITRFGVAQATAVPRHCDWLVRRSRCW